MTLTPTLGQSRKRRGRLAVAPLDYSEPVDTTALYKNVLRPALAAVGLPASTPKYTRDDGTVVPAVEGVRLHDLRHTFATLQLSAGVHFMQVSKWLGHSTFTLTLDVYGDWVPEQDGGRRTTRPSRPRPRGQPRPRQTWSICLADSRVSYEELLEVDSTEAACPNPHPRVARQPFSENRVEHW